MDSVCNLGGRLVAAKCVGLGKNSVFRAKFRDMAKETRYYKVKVLAQFGW